MSKITHPKNLMALTIIFFTILIPLTVIYFSTSNPPLNPSPQKISVAATIFPLADIISNIGGDRVQVIPLLPPGASPHSFSLTPRQLTQLKQAQTLFIIGHGLDDWAAEAVSRTVNIPLTIVDDKIALRKFTEPRQKHTADEQDEKNQSHEEGSIDPHYWLTVPNARQITLNISAELQTIDPEYADQYAAQTNSYLHQLTHLEQDLQSQAKKAINKEFIAIHDAWSYFANHYGFDLVATYEPTEGNSPSINDLRKLQNLISQYNIKTFYTEPQKQSTAATRFVTNDLGLEIEVLDPVGGLPPRDSYLKLMQENMRVLTQTR